MPTTKLLPEGREAWPALRKFAKHLVASRDIDPIYPVLRAIARQQELDDESALWLSLLYVAWYNLPSSWAAFLYVPERDFAIATKLEASWPTGIERRGLRGGKVAEHLESFIQATDHTTLREWFETGLNPSHGAPSRKHANWLVLNERLQAIWGNGRWAAYKHCEILRVVHGVDVEAPDMGHAFSSGPRHGLAFFYGAIEGQDDRTIRTLDRQSDAFLERLRNGGLDIGIEEAETILCNWHSMVKGRYYVGHDIDELQEQILLAREREILWEGEDLALWRARHALPFSYLGECNGWVGVQKRRSRAYRDTGRVLVRRRRD